MEVSNDIGLISPKTLMWTACSVQAFGQKATQVGEFTGGSLGSLTTPSPPVGSADERS
jgi:hypothetical protein